LLAHPQLKHLKTNAGKQKQKKKEKRKAMLYVKRYFLKKLLQLPSTTL